MLVKRKEVPAPERVVTDEITVTAKKGPNGLEGAGTKLATNRVTVEVGVFYDQIAAGCDKLAIGEQLGRDVVGRVQRIKCHHTTGGWEKGANLRKYRGCGRVALDKPDPWVAECAGGVGQLNVHADHERRRVSSD